MGDPVIAVIEAEHYQVSDKQVCFADKEPWGAQGCETIRRARAERKPIQSAKSARPLVSTVDPLRIPPSSKK